MLERLTLRTASLCFAALTACASGPKVYTKRYIDSPAGERVIPGAVASTGYFARVSMEHNIAHITVLERSLCPTIRLRIVERIEETLDGNKVVERVDKGSHELAETQQALMQCEARFARVPLSLRYGSETYPLGTTSEFGQLDVDLASAMKASTRALDLSAKSGTLLVQDSAVAEIAMAGLAQQQQQLDALLAQLAALLSKSETALSDADVTQASVLYQQMRQLGPDDVRALALEQRYLEVVGGFRDVKRTHAMRRNLSALTEAKELLTALAQNGPVPAHVHVSISSDQPSAQAIAWAQAQALASLHRDPAFCRSGFDWARVASLDPTTRVAFSYLRYAFDESGLGWLSDACLR